MYVAAEIKTNCARLLIPRYEVQLKKLVVGQIFSEFPAFRGTTKFFTVFRTDRHYNISDNLSAARTSHPISSRFI
jgi:hypothetical protein